MKIDRRAEAPYAGIRMIGKGFNSRRLDGEPFHLHALALGVAGKRAHVVDQMPGVVAPCPIAHRHRTSRNAGDDMAVEGNWIGASFEHAGSQVARPCGVTFFVDLLFRAVASTVGSVT